jgi:hypothetical protein
VLCDVQAVQFLQLRYLLRPADLVALSRALAMTLAQILSVTRE